MIFGGGGAGQGREGKKVKRELYHTVVCGVLVRYSYCTSTVRVLFLSLSLTNHSHRTRHVLLVGPVLLQTYPTALAGGTLNG